MSSDPGTLYIVATPIGNLQDITLRALRVLREVDLIAAEHVPVARALLRHFEIDTHVVPYHDDGVEPARLLHRIHGGESVAIVSDAGTPGLSDPGYAAVHAAHQAGLPVVPIPGPSAGVALWSVSGLVGANVVHGGFLPRRPAAVRRTLMDCAERGLATLVFEAPRRLRSTLTELDRLMPGAHLIVGRELTKLHEQIWRGSPAEALQEFDDPRGEFALLIIPPETEQQHWSDAEVADALAEAASQGASRSQAARHVAQRSGRPRREIYALWPFSQER